MPNRAANPPLRYVALGDSYTIGTSVTDPQRFPDQLVAALGGPGIGPMELVANLGVNGYTTGDLIREELPAFERLEPGFATLLIGVNDVVQDVADAVYAANLETILDALEARLPASRIVAIAIPDYTVTPAGADYGNPAGRHAAIVACNTAMAERCAGRSIRYVDIFDISRRAADDRSLVAADGLHPSGRQYAAWVERIRPVVEELLAG
jgi:acyl-CoA thioesterase I